MNTFFDRSCNLTNIYIFLLQSKNAMEYTPDSDFKGSKMLVNNIHNKQHRKIVESRRIFYFWDRFGGLESDGNEEVLHIPQSSSITGAPPSDYLMSYPGD